VRWKDRFSHSGHKKKPNWQPLPLLYLGKWFLLRCLPCSRNTIPRSLVKAQRQRWPDCFGYILRFRSSPDFTNSAQVQPQSNLFFKCEVQVQMKTKIFEKSSLFTRKIIHFFSINSRDERTVIFCDPDPVLYFKNSVQVQPQPKIFFKCTVEVQMKSKIFEKCSLFTTKMPHFFSINSVQVRSGS